MSVIVQLYCIFAKTAALTFGGGYAMIPLFHDELVTRHAFMDGVEFANLVALAQVTPGPLGLNAATYVGYSTAGLPGAVASTLGVMTPAFVVTLAVAAFLMRVARRGVLADVLKGVRPCVLGVIASAVVFFADTSLFTKPTADILRGGAMAELPHRLVAGICWPGVVIFLAVLAVSLRWKVNIVWLLLGSALAGWLLM